jgi:hypothetical protein
MLYLSQNILATVCYYDCLDFPLTAFEVWNNLLSSHQSSDIGDQGKNGQNKIILVEIIQELEKLKRARKLEEFQGFYFLPGRKNLVVQRIERNKISASKIKKLRRYVRILRLVPFVRMIALTGRLTMKNAQRKSDWDLLVVLEQGRIWTGRFLVTLAVQAMGVRRQGDKIKDRICLNHFLATDGLEIKLQDLFSAHEYTWMRPVFDAGIFQNFQIKNSWIRKYRPQYGLMEVLPADTLGEGKVMKFIKKNLEKLLGWYFLENWMRRWQKRKIENNPKTAWKDSHIDVSDEALVFLPDPQGPKIFECFQARLEKHWTE